MRLIAKSIYSCFPALLLLINLGQTQETGPQDTELSPPAKSTAVEPASALELGILRYKQGRHKDAEKLLTAACKANPGNAGIWYMLGKVHEETRGTGTDDYKKAYELEPDNLEYAQAYGSSMKSEEELKKHLKLYRFLAQKSTTVINRVNLAKSLYLNEKYEESSRKWKELIKIEKSFAIFEPMAVWSFLKSGDMDEAARHAGHFKSDYDLNLTLARSFYDAGKKEKAAHFYEIVRNMQPDNITVIKRLAELYESLKQNKKAVDVYLQALGLNPKDRGLQKQYLLFAAQLEDVDDKRKLYEFILKINPDLDKVRFKLSRAALAKKDRGSAYKHLMKVLDHHPKNNTYMKLLPEVVETDDEIRKNLDRLKKIRKKGVKSARLLLLLGRAFDLKKMPDSAETYYIQAYRLDSTALFGIKAPVLTLQAAQRYSMVQVLADRYLTKIDPADKQICEILVQSCEETGADHKLLRKAMTHLVKLDPKSKKWWLKLARLDLKAEDTTAAIRHAKIWLQHNSGSMEGHLFLLPLVVGRKTEQETHAGILKKLIKLDPENAAVRRMELGFLFYEQGLDKQAMRQLRKSIRLFPQNAKLWYILGRLHDRPTFKGDGREEYRKACRLEPENLKYARAFGRTLTSQENLKAELELFLLLNKNNPDINERIKLAKSYSLNGDFRSSAKIWADLLKKHPQIADSEPAALEAFAKTGEWEMAEWICRRKLSKEPANLNYLEYLGYIYKQWGKKQKYIEVLEKIVSLNADFKNFQLILAREKTESGAGTVSSSEQKQS
jgi:tetratricopeptide (TPR) repeat protein